MSLRNIWFILVLIVGSLVFFLSNFHKHLTSLVYIFMRKHVFFLGKPIYNIKKSEDHVFEVNIFRQFGSICLFFINNIYVIIVNCLFFLVYLIRLCFDVFYKLFYSFFQLSFFLRRLVFFYLNIYMNIFFSKKY